MIEELPVAIAVHRDETDDDPVAEEGEERRSRRGVLEAQLSLPEVLNVNVSHAMVSALRKKALAISEVRHGQYDSVWCFLWTPAEAVARTGFVGWKMLGSTTVVLGEGVHYFLFQLREGEERFENSATVCVCVCVGVWGS